MQATNQLLDAIHFAAHKHRDQRRKDISKTPYINHPIEVANVLAKNGVTDNNVLMAAVLHDTIEDTFTTVQEIIDRFGFETASIVLEVTDDKSLPKVERKKRQILHAPNMSKGAKLVKLADKWSNLRDLEQSPPFEWSKEQVQGYFIWCYAVVQGLRGQLPGLEAELDEIFEKRGLIDDGKRIHPDVLEAALKEYYATINNL